MEGVVQQEVARNERVSDRENLQPTTEEKLELTGHMQDSPLVPNSF